MGKIIIRPDFLFLLLGSLFGAAFLFVTPPFQAPDEMGHFYRSYEISEGNVIARKNGSWIGDDLPSSLMTAPDPFRFLIFHPEKKIEKERILASLSLPLAPNKKEFIFFPNFAVYPPVPFVPQAIGIAAARFWGGSPLVLFYAGRGMNFLVWVFLVFFSIRTAPFFKWVLLQLALVPMAVFQGASLSADAFTNGISFLFFSLCLKVAYGEEGRVKWWGLFFVSVLLSLSKLAYFPLLGLSLLIPLAQRGRRKTGLLFFCLLIFVNAALLGGWLLLVRGVYLPFRPDVATDPHQQAVWILSHLPAFLGVVLKTLSMYFGDYWKGYVGILGWGETPLPPVAVITTTVVLALGALWDGKHDIIISPSARMIFAGTWAATFLLVIASQYVNWTPVGKGWVEGVQGRYFIPLGPPCLALLYRNRNSSSPAHRFGLFLVAGSSAILLWALLILKKRYYG